MTATEFAEMVTVDGREVWVCPCRHVVSSGLPSAYCPRCRVSILWRSDLGRYVVLRSAPLRLHRLEAHT